MTRTTNARIAGLAYLLYIAFAFPAMVLWQRATAGQGIAAKLARIAEHAPQVQITILLSVLCCFMALTLAVTLYAITRDEDRDIAMLAAACRVGEGVMGGMGLVAAAALFWLATSGTDAASANLVGTLLLKVGDWNTLVGATFFAVGSTLFSYLLLRGRIVPVAIAWIGVIGSAVIVVGLPLQLAGLLAGRAAALMWLPVAVFELTVAPWLLIKGVREERHASN